MKSLTKLPLLEAILWESAWSAEVEGDTLVGSGEPIPSRPIPCDVEDDEG